MQLLEPLTGDMSIDLRGGYIGMAEQHLHHAQIRTMIKQVCGKGMTEQWGQV